MRERSSIAAQADELRLRVIEQRRYVDILEGKGKPKEMIALMRERIRVLDDAAHTFADLVAEAPPVPPPPKAVAKTPPEPQDPEDDY